MNPLPSEYIYNTVADSVVGALTTEVIVIGIFFVAFEFIQQIVKEPIWLRQSSFWKRLILLSGVVLFTTYIAAAYDIEYRRTIDADSATQASIENIFQAKAQLILLLAIDLIGVVLTCGLFASIYANAKSHDRVKPDYGLKNEIVFLFSLTSLWHLDMIAWWITYSFYSVGGMEWRHIGFHVVFVAAHGLFAFTASKGRPREWMWVGLYTGLVTFVYVFRIFQYVDRLRLTPVSGPSG